MRRSGRALTASGSGTSSRYRSVGRALAVVGLDLGVLAAGYVGAFLLRFDFSLGHGYAGLILPSLPLFAAGHLGAFLWFKLYSGIWRYASFTDLVKIVQAWAVGSACSSSLVLLAFHGSFPRSVLGMACIMSFFGVCANRFGIRFARSLPPVRDIGGRARSVLIVGAGDLGESLARRMLESRRPAYRIVGFMDDNPAKWRLRIHGIPVLGGSGVLKDTLARHSVDEIVIAADGRPGAARSVIESLRRAGVNGRPDIKVAPSLEEQLRSPGQLVPLRRARPADLLKRKPADLKDPLIASSLAGKTVLITGAGGTIGSELARQALRHGPSKVILLENHATSLFYLDRELGMNGGAATVVPALGDARDRALLDRVFAAHRPHIVLHAAAHKHLSQLETNVHEAISNNILATYYAARAAERHGAGCFLLISTDKAVRPSSVMGATKRAAEMVIQSLAGSSRTRFAAVRFGNVLGSSGSVLPLFHEQIAKGGPVTVTHPRATRFFMTVGEAVQLILHAAAISRPGEILILKMGTPVRILELAKRLIAFQGLRPGRDIKIRFTGLRPGEKLHEVLADDLTEVGPSRHPEILSLRPQAPDAEAVLRFVKEMESRVRGRDGTAEATARRLLETVAALPGLSGPDGRGRTDQEPGRAVPGPRVVAAAPMTGTAN